MPIIVEDTDPPFGPIAIMKYSDDGLYVPEADCAKLEIRYNALKEAVAWERECRVTRNTMRIWHVWPAQDEAQRSYIAARVEVDRLLGEK